MTWNVLDITPDPKVLIALTHTPLKPLDALCELIDNSIDSFRTARIEGEPEPHPLVQITVPTEAEVRRGEGVVRVADNGVGLDLEGLERSLRAGFSGKNRYDTLGLFGMGFNIATGKLGQRTTVITARRGGGRAFKVVLDLVEIVKSRSFEVPLEIIEKPEGLDHGTWVEVSHWWPEGSANAGFVLQLARIPKTKLREQIGRRYGTLLRSSSDDRSRVRLNGESVSGFEHCVWSDHRFVERQGWGMIPAQIRFDEVLASYQRCKEDGALLPVGAEECLECSGREFKTIDERIYGWVGVQRFDDTNRFGIDLIRNGRIIRVEEKDAFFNYTSDLGEVTREYPIDQTRGRLVGEVHLDRVPVDFGKQDFQRSSEEWNRALDFLRGDSLLPSSFAEGKRNESPVSRLFQGYRKVRNYGRQDMYMGRFDVTSGKAARISREIEEDYFRRFQDREPGYYDDAKWWELVESASVPPVETLEDCPECGYAGLPGADVCEGCLAILRGKPCVECGEQIQASAVSCAHCAASQVPEVLEPWTCRVCTTVNEVDAESCKECSSIRGTPNPLDEEALLSTAVKLDDLSFHERRFPLAGGHLSESLDVTVYAVSGLRPVWNQPSVPSISLKSPGSIRLFIDPSHDSFARLNVRPVEAVAVEAAQYLHSVNSQLTQRPEHSVQNIAAVVLATVWGDELSAGPDQVADDARALFAQIAERLASSSDASDFYEELDGYETRDLADRLIVADLLDKLGDMRIDGSYLRYAGPGVLARFFQSRPDSWFGTVWNRHLPDPAVVGKDAADNARQQITGVIGRCLEDCSAYLRYRETAPLIVDRVRAATDYLEELLT